MEKIFEDVLTERERLLVFGCSDDAYDRYSRKDWAYVQGSHAQSAVAPTHTQTEEQYRVFKVRQLTSLVAEIAAIDRQATLPQCPACHKGIGTDQNTTTFVSVYEGILTYTHSYTTHKGCGGKLFNVVEGAIRNQNNNGAG